MNVINVYKPVTHHLQHTTSPVKVHKSQLTVFSEVSLVISCCIVASIRASGDIVRF